MTARDLVRRGSLSTGEGAFSGSGPVAGEPFVVQVVARLYGQLCDLDVTCCNAKELEHRAGCTDGVGGQVLEADDEWLDLVRGEPGAPGRVVPGRFTRERVDLIS